MSLMVALSFRVETNSQHIYTNDQLCICFLWWNRQTFNVQNSKTDDLCINNHTINKSES